MKIYEITIREDKGLHIYRANKGFTVIELIGYIETIRNDLLLQFSSMMDKPDSVTRKFITDNKAGTVEVHVKEAKE